MKNPIVTIFGGSGFLGRYVVKTLCDAGYRIKVISLNPRSGEYLKPSGTIAQVNSIYGNICQIESVRHAIKGSDLVINLVGILNAHGKEGFSNIHAKGAENIAKVCSEESVKRLIHISALGVDKPSGSLYARSKLNGERAVLNAYPHATILRPAVIFGHEDNFFNLFAKLSHFLPVIPLIGGGKTKFQPVYAQDVADAIYQCIKRPETTAKIYELGGPNIYSFKELLAYILTITNRKRCFLPLPFALASVIGLFCKYLPTPVITYDQVKLLKFDNVVNPTLSGFKDLGIDPQPLEGIVPFYLTA